MHALVASHVHKIPTVGLRFFNVYGPRQDPDSPYSGVISIFCDRLRRGAPIEICGDGRQTRDFIYVADVVSALLAAIRLGAAGKTDAAVFNVCTGAATSVLELAETTAELLGRRPEINYRPARSGDIRVSAGSPLAARAELKLPTPMPLRAGLAKVLQWFDRAG
jgi:UDP-glucose 4-epimerase